MTEPVCAWPIDARQPIMSNFCWNDTEQEADVMSYPSDRHSILWNDIIIRSQLVKGLDSRMSKYPCRALPNILYLCYRHGIPF